MASIYGWTFTRRRSRFQLLLAARQDADYAGDGSRVTRSLWRFDDLMAGGPAR
jgi:hypothetical protein